MFFNTGYNFNFFGMLFTVNIGFCSKTIMHYLILLKHGREESSFVKNIFCLLLQSHSLKVFIITFGVLLQVYDVIY